MEPFGLHQTPSPLRRTFLTTRTCASTKASIVRPARGPRVKDEYVKIRKSERCPGKAMTSVDHRYSSSASHPASVARYRCLELLGFSGFVISRSPTFSNGRSTRFLNLVRSRRPQRSISSAMGRDSHAASSTCTWCRLSANLVPPSGSKFILGPICAFNDTYTAPPLSSKVGGSQPCRAHSSITRFVPRPQTSTAPLGRHW